MLANATMMRALRAVSSERGRDPREFALMAYGGAGPVYAAGLATALGISTVLVPPMAGFFSAVGLLYARPEFHDVRTCQVDPRTVSPQTIQALFDEMQASIERSARGNGRVEWLRSADIRYRGQSWEIEVQLARGPITPVTMESLVTGFEDEHELLYGVRGESGSPIELRAVRLAAIGVTPTQQLTPPAAASLQDRPRERAVHFDGTKVGVAVVKRLDVGPQGRSGPLLIDEYDTTVVVPPGWSVRRDDELHTLILESED